MLPATNNPDKEEIKTKENHGLRAESSNNNNNNINNNNNNIVLVEPGESYWEMVRKVWAQRPRPERNSLWKSRAAAVRIFPD